MTETCDASRRVFVRRSISLAACSCSLRCRSCTDLFMYILNEYHATPSGRRKTITPIGPSDWYASASAAPFTAVGGPVMGHPPEVFLPAGPHFDPGGDSAPGPADRRVQREEKDGRP